MTTEDIKAIKVLSIIAIVAVLEETQHKKTYIETNFLIEMKNYYLFSGHPLHSK